jgi:hypothetical protein
MRSVSVIITFLLCYAAMPGQLRAGSDPPTAGARAVSLGNAYTGIRGDLWTLYFNPAGISGTGDIRAGAYVERRFMLAELSYGTAAVVIPFKENHAAGISFGSFGFDAYRETHLSAAYATTLFDRFSLGAKLNYESISIAGYGSASTVFVDFGLLASLSESLSLGASGINLNQARIKGEFGSEEIPSLIRAGLAYQPTEKLLLTTDIQKLLNRELSFRGGIEYGIASFLKARAGFNTQPLTVSAGVGFVFRGITLDFASSYHEQLGYSPHISLEYRFGKP